MYSNTPFSLYVHDVTIKQTLANSLDVLQSQFTHPGEFVGQTLIQGYRASSILDQAYLATTVCLINVLSEFLARPPSISFNKGFSKAYQMNQFRLVITYYQDPLKNRLHCDLYLPVNLAQLTQYSQENAHDKIYHERLALQGAPVNADLSQLFTISHGLMSTEKDTQQSFAKLLRQAVINPALLKELSQALKLSYSATGHPLQKLPEQASELYSERPKGENARMFLERIWGKYLRCFGASEDCLYQDQLWKYDAKLMEGIKIYCRNRKLKVSDFIPPKKIRIDREIDRLSQNYKEVDRLISAKRRRLRKQKHLA